MAVRFRHNKIIHAMYNSAVQRLTSSGGICFESQPGENLSLHIFCGFIYHVTLLRNLLKPSQPGISSWSILATEKVQQSPASVTADESENPRHKTGVINTRSRHSVALKLFQNLP
jgi:hypothetical protein